MILDLQDKILNLRVRDSLSRTHLGGQCSHPKNRGWV